MDSMTFFRIGIDGRHVTGAGYALDDARIAASLRAAGTSAGVYQGRPDGQMQDIARQLARTRATTYVFHVTPDTAKVSAFLAAEVSRLRTVASFVAWGNIDAQTDAFEGFPGSLTLIPATSPQDVLAVLAGHAGHVEGVDAVSPYIQGILGVADLPRVGLSADTWSGRKLLMEELAWLHDSRDALAQRVPFEIAGGSEIDVVDVAEALREAGVGPCLSVRMSASACGGRSLLCLAQAGVTDVGVHGRSETVWEPTTELPLQVSRLDVDMDDRAALYAINGLIAYHSGMYFDMGRNPSPGIHHLRLPVDGADGIRQGMHAAYGGNMALRSAEILDGSDVATAEPPVSSGWPRHTYSRVSRADSNDRDVHVDGGKAKGGRTAYLPLALLDEGIARDADATIVTIRSVQDIAALEARLEAFHRGGHVRIATIRRPVYFENSCRWTRYGGCRVTNLRRLDIDGEGNVSTCIDAGALAPGGTAYEKLLVMVRQRSQQEDTRRGCAACPVRAECSHCNALPGEYAERYCSLRTTYPMTALYFELMGLPHVLGDRLPQEMPALTMTVAGEGLPGLHWDAATRSPRQGDRPLFIAIGDEHYAWWRGTRRVVRLSRPLVTMAEGWWLDVTEEVIAERLSSDYGVDPGYARSSLAEGLTKLAKGGVIHG